MSHQIKIPVKCPGCHESLLNKNILVDDLPAIALEAKIADKVGKIFLSQIYGSFSKKFEDVDDVIGSVAIFSCPRCHQPFPVIQNCECRAPLVGMQLEVGGVIKICSRNGCKRHSLEFEDVNDAFMLLMKNDQTGLG
jgi:hypothetical protein